MDNTQHRRASLRRLALWCAGLLLLVTSLSAFIRLSQAGLGCEPWPLCYGSALRAAQGRNAQPAEDSIAVTAARSAHRVIATVALAGVATMVALCFVGRPRLPREGMLALALLALVLGLAVLGLWTRGSRVPALALGNLLGGFLMFALCWRLAAPPQPAVARGRPARTALALAAALLLLAQIALGALTSASYAGLSCSDWLDCLRSSQAGGWHWEMLDPWREPVFDVQAGAVNRAGAVAQSVHRAGALLCVLVLVPLAAWGARGPCRRESWQLLALLALQLALGVLMVSTGLALPWALAHNVVACLMLAVAVRLI